MACFTNINDFAYKPTGEVLDRAAIDLGPYVPAADDDVLICRCEEVTKGDIRRAIHEGMYTMTEIRRWLRQGMGPCQGMSCTKLARRVIAAELHGTPAQALLEPETSRAPMRAIEMSVFGYGEERED